MAQGMLFHTLLAARPDVYLTQKSFSAPRRARRADALALRSLQDVVDRHAALRAGVAWEGVDRPVQRVSTRRRRSRWSTTTSPRGLDPAARAGRRRRAGIEAGRSAPGASCCQRPPLMRLSLLRVGGDAFRVLWTWHHLLLDGWSTQIVLGEVLSRYEARTRGAARALPARRPYADYLAWLARQDRAQAEAFWRARLRGFQDPTGLGVDRAAPDDGAERRPRGARGARSATGVVASLVEAARRLRGHARHGAPLGAWAVLLARYSGEDDVVFGATVSGRSAPVEGIASMVGLLINTLPVRVAVDPTRETGAFLAEAAGAAGVAPRRRARPPSSTCWDGARSGAARRCSRVSSSSRAIRLDATGFDGAAGLTIAESRTFSRTTYPLTIAVAALGRSPPGDLLRSRAAASAGRRRRADARPLRHPCCRRDGRPRTLAGPLGDLPLLAAWERRQLLVEWSATAPGAPPGARDPRALRGPGGARSGRAGGGVVQGVALSLPRDLDASSPAASPRSSPRLGRRARRARVAVLMPRGIELVIAELGILKAGAAFVPLDPEWPAARLAEILAELDAHASPADAARRSWSTAPPRRWRVRSAIPPGSLDRCGPRAPASRRRLPVDPEQPIYVIYTSGSTGKPKGVVVPHRGVNNRLAWMSDTFGAAAAASVLQTTRPVYDSSVWQIFWPLIHGGKTVLPAPGEEASAEAVARLVAAESVTMTDFVPSVFAAIVPALLDGDAMAGALRSLRAVVVGGEEIAPSAVAAFRGRFPGVRVVNLYGPTEASIGCICHEIRGDEGASIPIGRPIAGAVALVLDRRGGLSPIGAAGELHLTGRCLGLGYLGDPERTAAAFVANPFPEIACSTLYRTGDRARHLPDGSLEFLGRADQQVKLRGVRVELGEITAALASHPGVAASAALVREDRPGDRRLVALRGAARVGRIEALRRHLEERLPAGHGPGRRSVLLDALLLTAGGKLDRRALPAPLEAGLDAGARAWPRGIRSSRRWRASSPETLRVGPVGAHETTSSELGGHSLLATLGDAGARPQRRFAVDPPPPGALFGGADARAAPRPRRGGAGGRGDRSRASDRAGRAGRGAPAVLRAGAAVVRLAVRSPGHVVRGPAGDPDRGGAARRRRCLERRAPRGGAPPRGAADDLRRRGRAPGPDRARDDRPRASPWRTSAPCRRRIARRPCAAGRRPCWRAQVRSRRRPAAPGGARAPRAARDHLLVVTMHHIVSDA